MNRRELFKRIVGTVGAIAVAPTVQGAAREATFDASSILRGSLRFTRYDDGSEFCEFMTFKLRPSIMSRVRVVVPQAGIDFNGYVVETEVFTPIAHGMVNRIRAEFRPAWDTTRA